MFTIVRSSSVMKKPSDTTTSTAHGFPRSLVMFPTITERASITLAHNPGAARGQSTAFTSP